MARILKGSHSFTCTPHVHPLTEWTIPALAFPAKEAGTHRPRRDGRLSWPWVAGWLHIEVNVWYRELNPDTVAHLSTNRARHRLTSLIEANALTTTPDHHKVHVGESAQIQYQLSVNADNSGPWIKKLTILTCAHWQNISRHIAKIAITLSLWCCEILDSLETTADMALAKLKQLYQIAYRYFSM